MVGEQLWIDANYVKVPEAGCIVSVAVLIAVALSCMLAGNAFGTRAR